MNKGKSQLIMRSKKGMKMANALCFCIAIYTSANGATQTERQEKLWEAQGRFDSALTQIDSVGDSLQQKKDSHKILSRDLGSAISDQFARELAWEVDILAALISTNNTIGKTAHTARSLTEGQTLGDVSFANLHTHIVNIDHEIEGIQQTLRDPATISIRSRFKQHLDKAVDDLIQANPTKVQAYIKVRTGLAPGNVEDDIMKQRRIISSIANALKAVK